MYVVHTTKGVLQGSSWIPSSISAGYQEDRTHKASDDEACGNVTLARLCYQMLRPSFQPSNQHRMNVFIAVVLKSPAVMVFSPDSAWQGGSRTCRSAISVSAWALELEQSAGTPSCTHDASEPYHNDRK